MKTRLGMLIGILAILVSQTVWAQGPGGGGRGGRGGRGMGPSPLRLLEMEVVQKELQLGDDVQKQVGELAESLRADGPAGGGGGQVDFESMTPEEREQWMQQRRQEMIGRVAKELEGLGKVLSPEQHARLTGIYVQAAAAESLLVPAIAEKLGVTDDQKKQIDELQRQTSREMREQMQALFTQDDLDDEARRVKMTELRQAAQQKVLAALTAEQIEQLNQLKGAPVELPAMGRFGGGPGGGGRRNRDGQNRPARPE